MSFSDKVEHKYLSLENEEWTHTFKEKLEEKEIINTGIEQFVTLSDKDTPLLNKDLLEDDKINLESTRGILLHTIFPADTYFKYHWLNSCNW